jgi:Tol biopolymer transport system component
VTTNAAIDGQPAWSPDGIRLAFTSNRQGATNFDVYTAGVTGSTPTRLTTSSATDHFPDC